MCGIFGIFEPHLETQPDNSKLKQTAEQLAHRGPDASGIYSAPNIGLVHTRLSLLDLTSRGNQPFWGDQKRYVIVYNGEIYNFQSLRSELETAGFVFKTTCDTEVVLNSVICWGIKSAVQKFEGMFAFAVYDTHEKQLMLARDRYGIKPLFIYNDENRFIFSSTIMPMKNWISFDPDTLSILSYLQGFPHPSRDHTFYQNISIVEPGTLLIIDKNGTTSSSYYKIQDSWSNSYREELNHKTKTEIIDLVESELLDSVKMQLIADAPVGALCSGGVDSSLILAMASKYHDNLAVFHADVVGPQSEYENATKLAKHLKLNLETVKVHDRDFLEYMPEVTYHHGHPFMLHPNSVPFYLVSKLIRDNQVKAVLSGEGADECYHGYSDLIFNLRKFLQNLKHYSLHDIIQCLRGRFSTSTNFGLSNDISKEFGNRFTRLLEYDEKASFMQSTVGKTLNNRDIMTLYKFGDHIRTLLHRNDSLGMAHSIEARFPFLDSQHVKTAVNMPRQYKVRCSPFYRQTSEHLFFKDKWVLRKVADRYLPKSLSQQRKRGFPANAYSRMEINPKFFEHSCVRDFLGLNLKQLGFLLSRADHSLRSRLIHLEVWMRVCLRETPIDKTKSHLFDHITISN